MDDMLIQLDEAVGFLKNVYPHPLDAAIVLGSGLGNFTDEIKVEKEVSYADIPHFPVSTVKGHKGKLVFGKLAGKNIVCMAGRFHYYEGYSAEQVVFPIRTLIKTGAKAVFLSNAAGGVNEHFNVGDLMIIRDHISFAIKNPLIGKNIDELGTRFPDMSEPYKKSFITQAKEIAKANDIDVKEGVYFGVTGPTFETRAEYKMIRMLGGDAVGMSTVQEVIAANHMHTPVFAISVITDIGVRDEENAITHEEVLHFAKQAEPKLALILREMIATL